MTPSEILERMQDAHIAVVGDAMIDRYVFGRVERICPEAPVPIFIPERTEERPGGAANVLRQLSQLGCTTYQAFGPDRCIKTRYMAGQQLVLRVDEDKILPRTDVRDHAGVRDYLVGIRNLGAVVLSDYAKGWLSPAMCQTVIQSAAFGRKVPVIVDPKGADWKKFVGCELICPSTSDGLVGDFVPAFSNILWKRGEKGLELREAGETRLIPTAARRVYDVTGAGDTVVAVVAAAIAVGATRLEAAHLAALAAGHVVGEVGTTVCSKEKLKELIDAQAHA